MLPARRTKALMTSDADVVYEAKKGKLFLNTNGEEKGWGKKKVGGLIARFEGKPELPAEQFEGMDALMPSRATMATATTVTAKSRLLLVEKH